MGAVLVEVTAADIENAPNLHHHWDHPVRDALARLTGQEVDVDLDVAAGYIATIGQDVWTIVIGPLPEPVKAFLDYRWENGGPGEPFTFEIEVPEWVVALVRRATTLAEEAEAIVSADAHLAAALEHLQP